MAAPSYSQDVDLPAKGGANATGPVARPVEDRRASRFEDSNGFDQMDNDLQVLDKKQPFAPSDNGDWMGKVTTGQYQATGKKMEGKVAQANFARPAKVGTVKATGQMSTPSVKPFLRKPLPGMRTETAGGLPRSLPTKFTAGSHAVQPHIRNS